MAHYSPELIVVLILVLGAEFVSGWNDAPNAIATVVSTRVLPPRIAVLMAVIFNTVGAMSGTAVASTIGKAIIQADALNLFSIGAATFAILAWGTLASVWGMPISIRKVAAPRSEEHTSEL